MPQSLVAQRRPSFVLEHGTKAGALDMNGCSPIYAAAMSESSDILRLLFERSEINIEEHDKQSRTILHLAASCDSIAVVSLTL